jgi:hypothetical protein
MRVHREAYNSWGEFVDRASGKSTGRGHSSRYNAPSNYWDLNAGFEGALELARQGWPEGHSHVKKVSVELFDRISSSIERPYPVYDVEGSEIDVALYLDGEPECWQRMQERITEGPGRRIIKVVYTVTSSCGVDGRVTLAKGAAMVALVELLEFAGHGVQIDVMDCSRGWQMHSELRVRVKESDQPVDVSRVAFALAHPAVQRRLFFSVAEQQPDDVQVAIGVGSNYGHPADVINPEDRGDIYIGRSMFGEEQWLQPDYARAWVVAELMKQGISMREEF